LAVTTVLLTSAAFAAPVIRQSDDSRAIYKGAVADRDWGRPLASGDLDGDGYDDILVAAAEGFGGFTSMVYVIRGGPGAEFRGTTDLAVFPADQVILGVTADDNLGGSMATGDVNGDGIDDLLVCASLGDFTGRTNAGIAYLVLGGANFFDSPVRDLNVSGTWHMRVAGPVEGGDMGGAGLFGGGDTHAVAIGDITGDGLGDLVLGVHLADGAAGEAGRVYVIFGSSVPPPTFPGLTFNLAVGTGYNVRIDGDGELDELGDYVLTGDITGDGIDELIIPNQYFSRGGFFDSEGAVHIFRGKATWSSFHNLRTTAADITLYGGRRSDNLGQSAVVGDFNGDGIGDLATAAPGAELGTLNTQQGDGIVYGLFGSTAFQTGSHLINYLTATPDFQLVGEFQQALGRTIAAGDFNGDGYDDLAAGEWFAGGSTNGAVVVLLGRPFEPAALFTAFVDHDLYIRGAPSDRISFSLSSGDTGGDGRPEIHFGTPFNNGAFPNNAGTAYVATIRHGDADLDDDVDLIDYDVFRNCMQGPGVAVPYECRSLDFDGDSDVDLDDAAAFARYFDAP
jgi:hypothetical protein